jgi:hypothetical protein
VRDSLTLRAADFGIVLEDIAITHLSFGTEFTKAVEAKQVAEQDAERARFVVLKAEQVWLTCEAAGCQWCWLPMVSCEAAAGCLETAEQL